MRKARIILSLFLCCSCACYAQETAPHADTVVSYIWVCKQRIPLTSLQAATAFQSGTAKKKERKILFSVNGEAGYQHFSRDAASDDLLLINFSSDIATLRLNVIYKETYPFTVAFRYNKANPFQLDNQYELNLGFDDASFRQLLLQKIKSRINTGWQEKYQVMEARYKQLSNEYYQQKVQLESPVLVQAVVEERMRRRISANNPQVPRVPNNGAEQLPGVELPGVSTDSVKKELPVLQSDVYDKLLARRDSLRTRVSIMKDSLALAKQQLTTKLDSADQQVAGMNKSSDLVNYAKSNGVEEVPSNKGFAGLITKTKLRVGKFLLNNSELTVNNIFLHGASIKYGEEKFVMLSGGVYDFAFREVFNLRDRQIKRPRTTVFAAKFGKTDGRNLSAFTLYTGKKTKRNSINDEVETIAGVSVEKKIWFSHNLSVDIELAKSTTLNVDASKEKATIKDLFGSFSARTIGIYSAVRANLPKTKTDIEGGYRYWGQQFQSFNANQYFNPQNNIHARISQPFFNRKLYVTGGARYTDFKSFGIASNIKTKTLFASANATLRIRKLPIVSVGYYPGSQLYWLDQSRLYEYYYYIFNTTVSHYFNASHMPMQLVLTYNKFHNKYSDSLIAGSQSYYNVFWTAWKNRFSYTFNFSRQETELSNLHTLEAGIGYAAKVIKLGGSVKWNRQHDATGMGYSANLGLSFRKFGTISFIYDRSYLPDRIGSFIPVTMGQVQIVKPLKFSVWQ